MVSIFDSFTNLYSLPKTLRFELKPVGNTQKMLEEALVFQKDEIVQSNYEQIKPFFDELHRRFVQDALKNVHLDLAKYYEEFKKEKNTVKGKDDAEAALGESMETEDNKKKKVPLFQKEEEKLRKAVVGFFVAGGNEWRKKEKYKEIKFKKDDGKEAKALDVLFCKGTIEVLQKEFPEENYEIAGQKYSTLGKDYDDKPVNVFKWFLEEKFTTYFYRLHPSRENFYVAEDKDTAITNRIVNENMRRFAENMYQYEQNQAEYKKLDLSEATQKIFELNFYSSCLLQAGIDGYNTTIGGSEQQHGGQIGINQKINEYNQRNKSDKNVKKLKQFKKLYKQILSPKDKRIMNDIEKDEQVFPTLQKFIDLNTPKIAEAQKVLAILLQHAEDEEFLCGVYLKGIAINTLSNKYFLLWETLKCALMQGKGEKKKLPDFVTLAEVREALLKNDLKSDGLFKAGDQDEYKARFTENHWQTFTEIFKFEFEKGVQEFADVREKAKTLMESGVAYERNDSHHEMIKAVCDSALGVFQMMKYFALEKGRKLVEKERNEEFYTPFETYYGSEDDFSREIVRMYDNFRNYLTKKPYNEEKWKLNFEKGNLLKGWGETGKTKKAQYGGYILRKAGKYFLAVSEYDQFLSEVTFPEILVNTNKDCYEKLEYKQLNWGKNIAGGKVYPSYTRAKLGREISFQEHKKIASEKEHVQFLLDLIRDKYLVRYPELKTLFQKEYSSPRELQLAFGEIQVGGMKFVHIKSSWIEKQLLKKGKRQYKLFLFELKNKDFSKNSSGNKNLHTIYWELLFSDRNFNEKIIDFRANAEIFFRPETKKLPARKDKTGKEMTFVNKRKDGSPIELVLENRRYSENKVFFHCPIVLNFSTPEDKRINLRLNVEIMKHKNDFHIIGIDRGEKHLAYYSVINNMGKIVETGSFNTIKSGDKEVDYHSKLKKRRGKRDEARKDWKRIANIKELKTGYISQVVRKICDLILKYNAIVVLENLNAGFKRGRSALDFPIYQKLELALAKKLNFLVQKDAKEGQIGHPLKALQLTPPVQNFQDINRQTGVLFYTTAAYTSTTCPRCGWRKNKYISYENIEKAKKDFADIQIVFENGKFVFSYTSGTEEPWKGNKGKRGKVEEVFARDWKLYSDVARYRGQKNKNGVWEIKPYTNLTEDFKDIFEGKGIDLTRPDITEELIERGNTLGTDFWRSLTFLWNLLCQIRNSNSQEMEDIIACPSCHFHSEAAEHIAPLFVSDFIWKREFNGDANGAYNIARKGFMMLEKISAHGKTDPDFKKYPDIFISNSDWDNFVTKSSNV